MKVKASLCLLLVCLMGSVFAQDDDSDKSGTDFNGEFFQGMESGFFLRDTENGHREYSCPDPQINTDALRRMNTILGPVQMLLNLTKNDIVITAFKSVDNIVNSTFEIMASVKDYPGSEFCSGLLFGMAGSNLILTLGKDIISRSDNVSDLFKMKK